MNTATPIVEAQANATLESLKNIVTHDDLFRAAAGPAPAFSDSNTLTASTIRRMLDVGALDESRIPRFARFAAWLQPHVANHLKRCPTTTELLMTASDITAVIDELERLGWAPLEPYTSWPVEVADYCGQRLELARQHFEMLHGEAPDDAALWRHDELINMNDSRPIGSMIDQMVQMEKIKVFHSTVDLLNSPDPEDVELITCWLMLNNDPGGNLEALEDGLGPLLPYGDFPVRKRTYNRSFEFSDIVWCRTFAEVLDEFLSTSYGNFAQVRDTLVDEYGEWLRETVLLQDDDVKQMRSKALDLMLPFWRS